MQAAIYEGKEQLIVREVPDPVLGEGDILLSIDACCVCGTDLRTYRNGDKRIEPGRILGHEFCGTVVESRAPDSGLAPGDRVVMYIVILHGSDRYVERGRANLSAHRTTMSYHHDGAFAPLMKVPAAAVRQNSLFKVTSPIPSDQMSLAEPLGCVMNAHSRLGVTVWDTVVIIGAGPIGLMHAAVSRLQGAQTIILLDVNPARLEKATQFDIDATVLVKPDGSHRDEVARLTQGFGPDVVIVAVSAGSAAADGLVMAGKGARVCLFAGLPKSNPMAALDINQIHYKELTVSGSFSEKKSDFQAAFGLLQGGRFPSAKFVTHHLPLSRINDAFPLMESGDALKVCILPQTLSP
jgi:L-iditol 2-dehydrogenase